MTLPELHALQDTYPPKEERIDIKSISIDMDAPAAVRAQQYLEQVRNPYAFKCGDVAVNIGFTPEGKTLCEEVVSYLTAQK